jgi:DNA-binding MarR family transcriptional regulator
VKRNPITVPERLVDLLAERGGMGYKDIAAALQIGYRCVSKNVAHLEAVGRVKRERVVGGSVASLTDYESARWIAVRIPDQIVEQLIVAGEDGLLYSELTEALKLSNGCIRENVVRLEMEGRAERVHRARGGGLTVVKVTPSGADRHHQQPRTHTPEPAPDLPPRFPPHLSGEARTAAKVLASLQHPSPRTLAAAGGYTYPRAAELYEKVMEACQ